MCRVKDQGEEARGSQPKERPLSRTRELYLEGSGSKELIATISQTQSTGSQLRTVLVK